MNGEKICEACELTLLKFQEFERKVKKIHGGTSSQINQQSTSGQGNKIVVPQTNNMAGAENGSSGSLQNSMKRNAEDGTPRNAGNNGKRLRDIEFEVGDKVEYFDTVKNKKLVGTIINRMGKNAYRINVDNRKFNLSAIDIIGKPK